MLDEIKALGVGRLLGRATESRHVNALNRVKRRKSSTTSEPHTCTPLTIRESSSPTTTHSLRECSHTMLQRHSGWVKQAQQFIEQRMVTVAANHRLASWQRASPALTCLRATLLCLPFLFTFAARCLSSGSP